MSFGTKLARDASDNSSFFLAGIVLPAGLDLSGRIETEQ
jgi:hypothetical protein